MPNIDDHAKTWQQELSGRVGEAVKHHRTRLGLSSVQLAQRTSDLGYPISRVAVSKIETNARAGKVDLAELTVLARALDVPAVMLMYADLPDARVRLLPNEERRSIEALMWFSGEAPLPLDGVSGRRFDQLDQARDYNRSRVLAESSGPTNQGMVGVAQRTVQRPARRLRDMGYTVDYPIDDENLSEDEYPLPGDLDA